MSSKSVRDSAKNNQHYLTTLMNSNPKTINVITKNNESFAAVYVINDKDDNSVLYVGNSENISSRLKHHSAGTSSSDLNKKANLNIREIKWCKIRYRRMADEKQRKLFESYVIGVLKPRFNF